MHQLALSGDAVRRLVKPEQGARLAQIVNDAALEFYASHPDRFVAAIELPITDTGLCMKELDRMVGKPGMRAVNLGDTIAGRDYVFEADFAPVLARCEDLGYPLVFHNKHRPVRQAASRSGTGCRVHSYRVGSEIHHRHSGEISQARDCVAACGRLSLLRGTR
jgi:predicted TIM-barrel fold metal-dependent hydrolase